MKTISNYTNHIFHTEVDEVFAKHTWSDTQYMDDPVAVQYLEHSENVECLLLIAPGKKLMSSL